MISRGYVKVGQSGACQTVLKPIKESLAHFVLSSLITALSAQENRQKNIATLTVHCAQFFPLQLFPVL
jgi:hypothetical protein